MIIPLQRLVVLASAVLVAVCGCRRESEPPTNHQPSSGQQQDSTPSFAMNSDELLTASTENPQVVRGDTFEDHDYAFTLTRPSREWQFLNQRKAMQLTADAAMAMVNVSKQSYVAIIVERLECVKVTLTAWIAHRGNTAYLLLVIGEAGELSKPEAFRRFFALID